ncbi:MAG: hypothetical protein J1E01_04875 [Acetatifactor sp.]|nr:hypothetical protein [Acetatifactor sp.]
MLVAGAGLGTGILTLPYAISRIGVYGTLAAALFAYASSLIIYYMIADLALHSNNGQLLEILQQHLFRGKHKKLLTTIFFFVLAAILLENLVVYILCASDVITDLSGIGLNISKIIFYAFASVVVFLGIKAIGRGERAGMYFTAGAVFLLLFLSFFHMKNQLDFSFGRPSLVLAVYGLFMFAFSAIFSIVQVCNYIGDKSAVKAVVRNGLFINMVLTLIFGAVTILASDEVTDIATIGLSNSLPYYFVKVICSVFVVVSMLTSYWSIGLAFVDVIKEYFRTGRRISWLISTVPTIVIVLVLPLSVMEYVQLIAGGLSVMLGLLVIPAYRNAVKDSSRTLLLGKYAKSKILLGVAIVCVLLMAGSSFIPVR